MHGGPVVVGRRDHVFGQNERCSRGKRLGGETGTRNTGTGSPGALRRCDHIRTRQNLVRTSQNGQLQWATAADLRGSPHSTQELELRSRSRRRIFSSWRSLTYLTTGGRSRESGASRPPSDAPSSPPAPMGTSLPPALPCA